MYVCVWGGGAHVVFVCFNLIWSGVHTSQYLFIWMNMDLKWKSFRTIRGRCGENIWILADFPRELKLGPWTRRDMDMHCKNGIITTELYGWPADEE